LEGRFDGGEGWLHERWGKSTHKTVTDAFSLGSQKKKGLTGDQRVGEGENSPDAVGAAKKTAQACMGLK